MTTSKLSATDFISALQAQVSLPRNIELSSLKCGALASIFDQPNSSIISESIFSGVDPDPARAVLKGLVEFVERRAFSEGRAAGLAVCQTARSDGFAAYPIQPAMDAPLAARENALAEAVERFVWATWWDDKSISHSVRLVDIANLEAGETPVADLLSTIEIASLIEIVPKVQDSPYIVAIYFAFLDGGGVISGGACGRPIEIAQVRYRALGELLRHGLAVRKMRVDGLTPSTFYERRLAYFGNPGIGTDAVLTRIQTTGTNSVRLPSLAFDAPVPHSLAGLVAVHRCYFEDQPHFVGGALERLCL